MARPPRPDWTPFRRQPLVIPPDSLRAWLRLAVWESWMGTVICAALLFGAQLIVTAPDSIVTVFDFSNCYAAPPVVQPCERVAYKAGTLNMAFNAWCGMLLIALAAWLLWELWNAVAPRPIVDDFLKLLDDSFGHSWRHPRTWPWARLVLAYGFTLIGAALAIGLLASAGALLPRDTPTPRVETSQRFRATP
jgi:hypothetical protein